MALTKAHIDELNELLKDKKIILPDFRRAVSTTGQNTQWLKKNIATRNPQLPTRIKELINLI
jgi:hypothetical protein